MYVDRVLRKHGVVGLAYFQWDSLRIGQLETWGLGSGWCWGASVLKQGSCRSADLLSWVLTWKCWVELKGWYIGAYLQPVLWLLVPSLGQEPKNNLFLSRSWRIGTFYFPHLCQTFVSNRTNTHFDFAFLLKLVKKEMSAVNVICFLSTSLRILCYLGPRLLQGLFWYIVKKVICYLWKYLTILNTVVIAVTFMSVFLSCGNVSYHVPATVVLMDAEL